MAKVRVNNVRLSYANLLVPRSMNEGDTPAYSVALIIPKDSSEGKKNMESLREGQKSAAAEGQEKFGQNFAKKYRDLIKDGDEHDSIDLDKNPEYGNAYVVNTRNTRKPVVVDQLKNELHSTEDVYSGMWANVVLETFPYSHPTGGKGVSFSLRAVQKVRDDESFGGGDIDVDSEFDTLEVESEDDLLG